MIGFFNAYRIFTDKNNKSDQKPLKYKRRTRPMSTIGRVLLLYTVWNNFHFLDVIVDDGVNNVPDGEVNNGYESNVHPFVQEIVQ